MSQQASVICQQARMIAKCPGFTQQSGIFFNALLATLSQNYDWPQTQQLLTFPIGPLLGSVSNPQLFQWYPLTLPNGIYLRTQEVFYNVQGTIFYLNQLDKKKYDQLFQGAGISNYPYWYVVDQSITPPAMAFYPPVNVSLQLYIRVQFQPNDITNPETSSATPWFPNQRLLISQLAADLMQITGDSRRGEYQVSDDDWLKQYLLMIDDKENVATTVALDPLRFRSPQALPPTKTTGF